MIGQPKVFYKLFFITKYKHIDAFEAFLPEDNLGISRHEVKSSTIEALLDDEWQIEVLLQDQPDIALFNDRLLSYCKEHDLEILSNCSIEAIEDRDWVTEYNSNLRPFIIGDFIIASPKMHDSLPQDKTPIFIEASRAFGTGEHHTTALCTELIAQFQKHEVNNVLDLGTGSGILSFVAEKLWPKARIIGCDIESVAVEIATLNKECNNSKAQFYQNTEDSILRNGHQNDKFDLIVSNILSGPLISLADQIYHCALDNAVIILSGFLDYQTNSIIEKYSQLGCKTLYVKESESWVAIALQKKILPAL